MRTERVEGPTPAGGAWAHVIYDDAGRITEIHEFDENGQSLQRTYADPPDPHVESLTYRFVPVDEDDFAAEFEIEGWAPTEHETPEFKITLHRSLATVEMREHHATVESARAAVERVLKAWEVSHALRGGGRPEFRFVFEDAQVTERSPGLERPPGEGRNVQQSVKLGAAVEVNTALALRVKRGGWPRPPTDFEWTPDAETLWIRWQGYLAGKEPLPAMAYACLTLLERRHGGRAGAAAYYGISSKVLGTLGRLSTETGDERTARKLSPKLLPLTRQEQAWLEAAVKALIRRVGEVAAAGSAAALPPLTLADLPDL